jgi:hypothetical protein
MATGPKPTPAYERVMRRSSASADRSHGGTPCVECSLSSAGGSYPVVQVGDGSKTQTTAARIVWEHKYGPIDEGQIVCRDCDNPRCVSIKHLSLGTHAAKAAHKVSLGRQGIGASTLSEKQVSEVVAMRQSGKRVCDIARHFCVRPRTISNVCNRKTWKRITT